MSRLNSRATRSVPGRMWVPTEARARERERRAAPPPPIRTSQQAGLSLKLVCFLGGLVGWLASLFACLFSCLNRSRPVIWLIIRVQRCVFVSRSGPLHPSPRKVVSLWFPALSTQCTPTLRPAPNNTDTVVFCLFSS